MKGGKSCGGVVVKYSDKDTAEAYVTFPLVKKTSHQAEVDVIHCATEVLLNKVWPLWFDLREHFQVYVYNDNNIAVRQVNGHNVNDSLTKNKIQNIKNNLTLIGKDCIIKVRCRRQKSAFSMYSAHYFARNHIDEERVLVYSI
jgi:hypothetical protein